MKEKYLCKQCAENFSFPEIMFRSSVGEKCSPRYLYS